MLTINYCDPFFVNFLNVKTETGIKKKVDYGAIVFQNYGKRSLGKKGFLNQFFERKSELALNVNCAFPREVSHVIYRSDFCF